MTRQMVEGGERGKGRADGWLQVTVYRDFLFTASKDRTIKMWDLVSVLTMLIDYLR